ncbi:hypothetical protein ACNKHP_00045 [Shigella boydii]
MSGLGDTDSLVEKLASAVDTLFCNACPFLMGWAFPPTRRLLNTLLLALACHNIDNKNHRYINYY